MFGAPEFEVNVVDGIITRIKVLRGAPCGATWETARCVENLPIEEAIIRIGLDVQYCCIADPAGWDPICGKSPVHLAGKFHTAALKKALNRS